MLVLIAELEVLRPETVASPRLIPLTTLILNLLGSTEFSSIWVYSRSLFVFSARVSAVLILLATEFERVL